VNLHSLHDCMLVGVEESALASRINENPTHRRLSLLLHGGSHHHRGQLLTNQKQSRSKVNKMQATANKMQATANTPTTNKSETIQVQSQTPCNKQTEHDAEISKQEHLKPFTFLPKILQIFTTTIEAPTTFLASHLNYSCIACESVLSAWMKRAPTNDQDLPTLTLAFGGGPQSQSAVEKSRAWGEKNGD